MYTGNKAAKFQGNILSLSENIAKVLGGLLFWLTLYTVYCNRAYWMHTARLVKCKQSSKAWL